MTSNANQSFVLTVFETLNYLIFSFNKSFTSGSPRQSEQILNSRAKNRLASIVQNIDVVVNL